MPSSIHTIWQTTPRLPPFHRRPAFWWLPQTPARPERLCDGSVWSLENPLQILQICTNIWTNHSQQKGRLVQSFRWKDSSLLHNLLRPGSIHHWGHLFWWMRQLTLASLLLQKHDFLKSITSTNRVHRFAASHCCSLCLSLYRPDFPRFEIHPSNQQIE